MKAQMFNKKYWILETNPDKLKKYYKKLLEKSGFEVINYTEHYFNPIGYTALFLLSESHLAIHTFPEESKTYIEISSCVKKQFEIFVLSHKGSKRNLFRLLAILKSNFGRFIIKEFN